MSSSLIIGLFVVAGLLALVTSVSTKKNPGVYKSKPLMTGNEIEFFSRLCKALPQYHVFPQVAMGAIMQANIASNDKNFWKVRGAFAQKICDYVICDRKMGIIAIVELDDRTHVKEKDERRDAMLNQAGYHVIRWESRNKPTHDEILQTVRALDR